MRDTAVLWLGLQCIVFAAVVPAQWLSVPGAILLVFGALLVRRERSRESHHG